MKTERATIRTMRTLTEMMMEGRWSMMTLVSDMAVRAVRVLVRLLQSLASKMYWPMTFVSFM